MITRDTSWIVHGQTYDKAGMRAVVLAALVNLAPGQRSVRDILTAIGDEALSADYKRVHKFMQAMTRDGLVVANDEDRPGQFRATPKFSEGRALTERQGDARMFVDALKSDGGFGTSKTIRLYLGWDVEEAKARNLHRRLGKVRESVRKDYGSKNDADIYNISHAELQGIVLEGRWAARLTANTLVALSRPEERYAILNGPTLRLAEDELFGTVARAFRRARELTGLSQAEVSARLPEVFDAALLDVGDKLKASAADRRQEQLLDAQLGRPVDETPLLRSLDERRRRILVRFEGYDEKRVDDFDDDTEVSSTVHRKVRTPFYEALAALYRCDAPALSRGLLFRVQDVQYESGTAFGRSVGRGVHIEEGALVEEVRKLLRAERLASGIDDTPAEPVETESDETHTESDDSDDVMDRAFRDPYKPVPFNPMDFLPPEEDDDE